MARSNGQPGQAGGRTPQARQPAEPEFYAQTTQPTVPPHNLQYAPYQPAPAAYGAPVQQPNPMPQARPQQGYPPQGYYQPAQPQQQAYHEPAPAYAPQVAQPEQGYYPQHQAEPQQHADPNAGYAPQQQHFGGPQQPNPGYAPAQPPAPQAQQYAPQWSPQQAADPRGYDLGHFASAHDRTQPGHGQSHYQQGYAEPQQYAQEPAWDDPRAAYAQQHAEQPRIDPSHYGAQPTLAAARQGQPMPLAPAAQQHAQGYAEPHEDEYYDDDEEAAEPRRRGRGLLVVAGLVMAISAGAGLAYAYTQFGPSAGKGKAAILKADAQAGRMREASDADRKLPNRLAEDANGGQRAAPQTPETPDDPNAPRRVRTTTTRSASRTPSHLPPRLRHRPARASAWAAWCWTVSADRLRRRCPACCRR